MVNTTWFPLADFFAFMGLAVYGWTFISLFNCFRTNPVSSGNHSFKDFALFLPLSILVFFMSGIIVWRQKNDLSGYCTASAGAGHSGGKHIFLRESEPSAQISSVLGTENE